MTRRITPPTHLLLCCFPRFPRARPPHCPPEHITRIDPAVPTRRRHRSHRLRPARRVGNHPRSSSNSARRRHSPRHSSNSSSNARRDRGRASSSARRSRASHRCPRSCAGGKSSPKDGLPALPPMTKPPANQGDTCRPPSSTDGTCLHTQGRLVRRRGVPSMIDKGGASAWAALRCLGRGLTEILTDTRRPSQGGSPCTQSSRPLVHRTPPLPPPKLKRKESRWGLFQIHTCTCRSTSACSGGCSYAVRMRTFPAFLSPISGICLSLQVHGMLLRDQALLEGKVQALPVHLAGMCRDHESADL